MMLFWFSLILLLLVASVFFLWPLRRMRSFESAFTEQRRHQTETNIQLYREQIAELERAKATGDLTQEAFDQLKLEQDRALLDDEKQRAASARRTSGRFGAGLLASVGLLAFIAALVLYQQLGSLQDVRLQALQKEKNQLDWEDIRNQREPDPARTRELVTAIEQRLTQRPDNHQYRFLLGRYALSLGDYGRAVEAYEQLLSRMPDSARVRAELGQALFLSQDNRMTPRVAELAQDALAINPRETTALGLAGINAFQQQNFQQAIDYWQRAVDELGANSPESRSLKAGIAKAREALPEGAKPDEKAVPEAVIKLRVSLAENADLAPDKSVFVYARAWEGSRMPLAVTRVKVSELPVTITLGDTMAMTANAALSQEDQVELVARVSMNDSPSAQPGDWQGTLGPVDPSESTQVLDLTIDRQITE